MNYSNQQLRRESPDRVYGEVYEFDGQYWAEVILMQDGLDWVTEKSEEFGLRSEAVSWLAARDIELPKSVPELLFEGINRVVKAVLWTKLGDALRPGQSRVPAAA